MTSIYCLKLPIKNSIDQADMYGYDTMRFEMKQDAISRINSWMSYCCRNNLNGKFKTELVTSVHNDTIIYFASIIKI